MDLASKYAKIIKSRLMHYAAWSPVTDPYEIGDYGAFRRGIFQKLGNIREFGVQPQTRPGTSSVSLDFTSSGSTMVRTAGGAKVDVFPQEAVEGTLEIDFQGDSSIFVRTGKLSMTELTGVDSVAGQLLRKRDPNGRKWKLGWRIIRKLYVATDPVILVSAERGASFSLSGRADALKAAEAGSGSADLSVSSNKSDSLQILGGTGPVAFDLFKVRVTGRANVSFGTPGQESQDEEPELDAPDLDDEWSDELEDDDAELFE